MCVSRLGTCGSKQYVVDYIVIYLCMLHFLPVDSWELGFGTANPCTGLNSSLPVANQLRGEIVAVTTPGCPVLIAGTGHKWFLSHQRHCIKSDNVRANITTKIYNFLMEFVAEIGNNIARSSIMERTFYEVESQYSISSTFTQIYYLQL